MSIVITICIPAYNAMPHLPKAIMSTLSQTYRQFELLIIDDGSTDDTRNYLNSIDGVDPRLTVIRQDNKGLGATLNRSIKMCKTKYYARMDADDIMCPERIQKQISYLEANPDVVLLGGKYAFMTGLGTIRGNPVPLEHVQIMSRLKKAKAGFCHPTVIFRTDAAKSVGGYRISGVGEDYDFFLRMAEVGKVANIPDVVLKYRVSEKSTSFSQRNAIRCGAQYAIHSYNMRQCGRRELSFNDFNTIQNKSTSFFSKLIDQIEDVSFELFRKSLIQKCSGHKLQSLFYLGVASFMRPRDLTWQLWFRFRNRKIG